MRPIMHRAVASVLARALPLATLTALLQKKSDGGPFRVYNGG